MFTGITRYCIFTLVVVCLLLFQSCKESSFECSQLNMLENCNKPENDSTINLSADLNQAVLNGLVVPSMTQTKNGYFNFSFKVKNNSSIPTHFWYKIYYQNETYKLEEEELSGENFYGSWEHAGTEFKATPEFTGEIMIRDSFRIVGNPREEKIYFGKDLTQAYITEEKIKEQVNYIETVPDWKKGVEENAIKNKVPYADQAFCDAVWSLSSQLNIDSTSNNRWKRNPRMGKYKFMVVVANDKGLMSLDETVRNIRLKDAEGHFTNPFTYFKDFRKQNSEVCVLNSTVSLSIKSHFNIENGVYVNRLKTTKQDLITTFYNADCNNSASLYQNAQFEQYFHPINKSITLRNINEIADVSGGEYTRALYESNLKKYKNSKDVVNRYMDVSRCPCKTVGLDSNKKGITIRNPGGEFKKEQVGISSRIGFTYGKWRAKIRFPKLINSDNVWNGLTAAYWLIFQDEAKWNYRRICDAEIIKYIPKDLPDNNESAWKSVPQTHYSEIDFEIVKESSYWTPVMYGKRKVPTDDPYNSNDITVTCTNWDLACHQPKNFLVGAKDITIEGKTYHFGRWTDYYKAVTSKVQVKHEELMGQDYYYEIDWQPKRIIWRIGKDKNNMREICRMNDEFTSIPNNQMIMMLTQEFHYEEWWPTAPYKQNFIPFPKKDLVGTLLELEVE
jgi:hypothetical protein